MSHRLLLGEYNAGDLELAQQHRLDAEQDSKQIPGISDNTPRLDINSVAIIGSGLMGCGIAINFLLAGIPTTLLDANEEALARGTGHIEKTLNRSCDKGRISQQECDHAIALLTSTQRYQDLSSTDLVIEAVFENMEVKKSVFQSLDQHCRPGAILASNTSTLDLDQLAQTTSRPESVIGLHFFSPANIMKLLEVVRGKQTAPEVLATCLDLAVLIKKIPVVVGVCYGFVGNRMLAPYSREAFRLLLEGASPEQVDGALRQYGMAMGAVEMADMAGIDVGCMAALANQHEWQGEESYQALQFALREQNRLGQKSGAGVYNYQSGEKILDPVTSDLALEIANKLGIEQREISDLEIIERCLYSMVNEGAKILDENIAYRAGDIDLIYLNGYGFPKWRGGPMHWANQMGLATVLAGLEKYQQQLGDYGQRFFAPAQKLKQLVETSSSFN